MTIEDILSKFDEKTVSLALELRTFILSQLKDAIEIPDQSANIIGYGYGTGYKDNICTILLSKAGVKLGFNRGGELPDPDKILTGTGKVHRFVEIKDEKTIRSPALKKMMLAAFEAWKKRKQS